MIIVTSLSPAGNKRDTQIEAIKSWQQFGDCCSLNKRSEIEMLDGVYDGIDLIETNKTVEALFGKPLVTINAMIDLAISLKKDLLIINSDIFLKGLPQFKENGISILSRYDYTEHFGDAKIFTAGFDLLYIPKQFLNIFPPSIYAQGFPWWDYVFPFRAQLSGVPVYWPQDKFAYHKKHGEQYSYESWLKMGELFRWEFDIDKKLTIPQIATIWLSKIKSQLIKI